MIANDDSKWYFFLKFFIKKIITLLDKEEEFINTSN